MQPSTDNVQRLMEVGFVAVGNGLLVDAETIFFGVQAVRPDSELPLIGRAFLLMNSKLFGDAIQLLRLAVEKNPDSDFAVSFLGAALKMSGHNHAGNEVLQQVLDEGNHVEAVNFAQALMQNLE